MMYGSLEFACAEPFASALVADASFSVLGTQSTKFAAF